MMLLDLKKILYKKLIKYLKHLIKKVKIHGFKFKINNSKKLYFLKEFLLNILHNNIKDFNK